MLEEVPRLCVAIEYEVESNPIDPELPTVWFLFHYQDGRSERVPIVAPFAYTWARALLTELAEMRRR